MADSLAWQTHLPDATADNTSLLNQAHVQYQRGTGGSTVEKPAETQTNFRLASHLVRAPNSRSGGPEFKSPMWRELSALTKSGKILGVRPFYSGDPDVITVCLAALHSQASIWLASHLVRRPFSRLNPLCGGNSVHWLKSEKILGVRSLLKWWPRHDHMIMLVCLAA